MSGDIFLKEAEILFEKRLNHLLPKRGWSPDDLISAQLGVRYLGFILLLTVENL